MSLVIENCKGHVHVVGKVYGTAWGRGAGFYKLEPKVEDTEGAKVLILGIPLNFREIVQPTVTLDEKRTLYVFGSAWNEMALNGLLLLGENKTGGAQVEKLLDWYAKNRVSELKDSVQVSLGPAAVKAYVVGLRLEAANPKFNTQAFSIVLLTADIKPK